MKSGARLLFLLNDAPFFVSHRLSVAVAARNAGFEVHVALPRDDKACAIIEAAGVITHDVPLMRGAVNPLGEIKLFAAYRKLIAELKPDMVHAVTMKPGAYGGAVARMMGVPALVVAVTGMGFLFLRDTAKTSLLRTIVLGLYRYALGHANCRVIFQNPDDRSLFEERGMTGKAPVHMIKGCGIDLAHFAPTPEPEGPPVVVFPARLIGDKGIHEFVAAARAVRDAGLEARFRLVGRTDPDNPTDVGEATLTQWQNEGIVEWAGYSEDMPGVFAGCHIVCMPSYREGLPRVLMEAAACGRAIVTTDAPGCREVVTDGENGTLCPVGDGKATAEAVLRLIRDGELRRQFGRRGRALAEAEFSVEDFVARSLAVYDELMPSQ